MTSMPIVGVTGVGAAGRRIAGVAILLVHASLLLTLAAPPASAHAIKLFATAAGGVIEGRVYVVGGRGVAGARLRIEAPPGTPASELASGDDGTFRFAARLRADHLVIADAGDGHVARFVVTAAELPLSLPPPNPANDGVGATAAQPAGAADEPGQPAVNLAAGHTAAGEAALADVVAAAVARQIEPLRRELAEERDAVRLRDVLGGLGWIVGLAGIALWARGRGARRTGAAGG